jgi:hypothetical protein
VRCMSLSSKAIALVTALNIIYVCNTFQHFIILYLSVASYAHVDGSVICTSTPDLYNTVLILY